MPSLPQDLDLTKRSLMPCPIFFFPNAELFLSSPVSVFSLRFMIVHYRLALVHLFSHCTYFQKCWLIDPSNLQSAVFRRPLGKASKLRYVAWARESKNLSLWGRVFQMTLYRLFRDIRIPLTQSELLFLQKPNQKGGFMPACPFVYVCSDFGFQTWPYGAS